MNVSSGKRLLTWIVAALIIGFVNVGAIQAAQISALFMNQAGYSEDDIRAITAEFEAAHPDISVDLTFVSYEELYNKIVVAAASGASTYDVVLVDVIWPAAFVSADWLLDVTDRLSPADRDDIFPEVLSSAEYKGRLYGMPWLNDWEYFFYNRRMLDDAGIAAPPESWEEVVAQGEKLKGAGIVRFPYIDAWQQGEALTIEFIKFVTSFGGALLDDADRPTLNQGASVKALQFMIDQSRAGIFHPASIESEYEALRHIFSQGEAAFANNWYYMEALANDPEESLVAGQVEMGLIPGGEGVRRSVTINGAMSLSVMKSSRNPDEAWQYITYMSSRDVQKRYSRLALPIWKSLYSDPDLVREHGALLEISRDQLQYMVARPQVPWYPELSQIVAEEVQYALTGRKGAQQALDDAAKRIDEVRNRYQ